MACANEHVSLFAIGKALVHLLPEESGIDYGYREHSSIQVAFTTAEAETLKTDVP